MTRTLHDGLYLSISPFKLEDSFLQATRDFTVTGAGCFNEKDKSTITAMIDRFEQGGTKAFEAKIAQVGLRVVAQITGRKPVHKHRALSNRKIEPTMLSVPPAQPSCSAR